MLVFKKKEIVAAALVCMIGVAGYLNWSYSDTVKVTDSDSYTQTGKKLGKAQFVSSKQEVEETGKSAGEDYFAKAKTDKETAKSQALEILKDSANNESFDKTTRKQAQEKILKMAEDTEHETEIENLARAKGYDSISVSIDNSNVNVIIKKDGFNQKDAAVLCDLITKHLNTSADKIKIVEKK